MDSQEDSVWKESFFKDYFSVDLCLSKYTQKSDLETLRRDLKNYGADLQLQMSEILKTETEAIVNLAEYLTNLNFKIENISVPICQLREEIMALYTLIKTAEASYRKLLEELKNNNTKRNNILLKLGMISSSDYISKFLASSGNSYNLMVLERLVMKYSFEKNYMDELGIIAEEIDGIVKNVEEKLVMEVNKRFLESFNKDDAEVLTRCLRMYDNLRKQDEAQTTFRINIVKPYMEHILIESNLEKHHQNLDLVYDEVLFFMENKMNVLFQILEKNPDVKGYNFISNSFWLEFDKQSRQGLQYITAPGNPELFQKRFKSTWNVLQKIARKCGDENLLITDETFQEHLKRFNLPVYYEITYQKIAGNFENSILIDNCEIYASTNELSCKLKHTIALKTAVEQCFHVDVYIDQLADQFLRLSMMMLSRYLECFKAVLEDSSSFSDTTSWETFIMDSLLDFKIIENLMAVNTDKLSDIENTVFRIMNPQIKPIILNVFKTNKNAINKVETSLKTYLITIISQESLAHLQNVEAIPRLYRRTNRTPPKVASSYMSEAIEPILGFHSNFAGVVDSQLRDILDTVINNVTKRYLNLVQEVLSSVCKTKESLRRLKNRSSSNLEETSSQSETMTDEMKIRLQIKYDVEYFLKKLYPLGSPICTGIMDLLQKEISNT